MVKVGGENTAKHVEVCPCMPKQHDGTKMLLYFTSTFDQFFAHLGSHAHVPEEALV